MNEIAKNHTKAPQLKPKYQLYADSILQLKTQRQSALDAGIPKKRADTQANRMSKNDKVIAYIRYHRDLQATRNEVSLEDVVPTLRKIRDDNVKTRPHVSVSACAELSKIGRLYEPTVINNTVVTHNALTIVHAPGAMEAIEEERKKAQDS